MLIFHSHVNVYQRLLMGRSVSTKSSWPVISHGLKICRGPNFNPRPQQAEFLPAVVGSFRLSLRGKTLKPVPLLRKAALDRWMEDSGKTGMKPISMATFCAKKEAKKQLIYQTYNIWVNKNLQASYAESGAEGVCQFVRKQGTFMYPLQYFP